MYRKQISATLSIGKHDRDCHRALQRRICCFELVFFDDLFIRHKLHKAPVVGVGVRCCLADLGRFVVGERYPEDATLASFKLMHVAGHAGRHFPLGNLVLINESIVDSRARRTNVAAETGQVIAHTIL